MARRRDVTIVLNLGTEPVSLESSARGLAGEILLSTLMDRNGEKIEGTLDLRANEGVIIGDLGEVDTGSRGETRQNKIGASVLIQSEPMTAQAG